MGQGEKMKEQRRTQNGYEFIDISAAQYILESLEHKINSLNRDIRHNKLRLNTLYEEIQVLNTDIEQTIIDIKDLENTKEKIKRIL